MTLYIDPGTTESHAVAMDDGQIIALHLAYPNSDMMEYIRELSGDPEVTELTYCSIVAVVIEGITPQGIMGQTTLDTVFWSGRFAQASPDFRIINRQDVKRFWKARSQYEGNMNDKKIKDAIRELYPDPERDKMLKGKSHCWQAYAMGLMDWLEKGEQ